MIKVWCLISTLLILILGLNFSANAQNLNTKASWLNAAELYKPLLIQQELHPRAVVACVKSAKAYQNWTVERKSDAHLFFSNSIKSQSGTIVDFGNHFTGYVTFSVDNFGPKVVDAAVRLKFTFAETPAEVALPFDPYDGLLSRAWLQDEVVTISEVPATIQIPRRVAFRYLKIEVLGSSVFSDFKISDIVLHATTSAKRIPEPLSNNALTIIKKIDQVGLNTLKECMQSVYEDGPKRDRRLWVGDLYLESLANSYSFKNDSLTKRCLYLLAGLCNEEGIIPSNIFERPTYHAQNNPIFDYSLLFNVLLKEYVLATGDKETALELWPVVKKQLEIPEKYLLQNGMLDYEKAGKEWWLFFDWNDKLDKQASLQGNVIWAYQNTLELAQLLGKEKEVADLIPLIKKMSKAARKNLYDEKRKLFISGNGKQLSYASQAWMVLSGVLSPKEGSVVLKNMLQCKEIEKPGAPYLYHYVIEALIKAGLNQEAKDVLINYWGGMVEKGADTFWEVYNPENEMLSPYNSILVNSYCHAWSCTPVYFIRKYPNIFQK